MEHPLALQPSLTPSNSRGPTDTPFSRSLPLRLQLPSLLITAWFTLPPPQLPVPPAKSQVYKPCLPTESPRGTLHLPTVSLRVTWEGVWPSSTLLSITVPRFPPRGKAGDPNPEPHESYLILFLCVVHIELNCSVGVLRKCFASLALLCQLPDLYRFCNFP